VRDAILDASAALAADKGLLAVTMSQIARRAGIGRATLYKYFPDVGAILLAWHEREVSRHLEQLRQLRDQGGPARDRLAAVLEAYALIAHEHQGAARHHGHLQGPLLAALLHRGGHVARAARSLRVMIRELIADAAAAGDVRDDVEPEELATYCLHALGAARDLPSRAAVRRLVSTVLAGLRPGGAGPPGRGAVM
jgi:AcrR family transcriptional regulator